MRVQKLKLMVIAMAIAAPTVSSPAWARFPKRVDSQGSCGRAAPVYNGGDILPNVRVVAVMWSTAVSSTIVNNIGNFYRAITDNEWMDFLQEYYSTDPHQNPVSRGSFGGTFTINPSTTHGMTGQPTLTDADIGTELAKQINSVPPALPAPTPNTVYMIHFPKNFSITLGTGQNATVMCGGACAEHTFTTQIINGASTRIPYAVVPDQSSPACFNLCSSGTAYQQDTISASHEMAEAITDPFISPNQGACPTGGIGLGWCPEIGDPCECASPVTITDINQNSYTVQPMYHIDTNSCTPTKTPLCEKTSNAWGESKSNQAAAPNETEYFYSSNSCSSSPINPAATCQNVADMYGLFDANINFMPSQVQWWYDNNSCGAMELDQGIAPCQRASDDYGIVANLTWGSAPPYIQSWWNSNGCDTVPRGLSPCQKAADLYGFAPGTTGFAPSDIQSDWNALGCTETTTSLQSELCQNASNIYGIVANVTWGIAPVPTQNWWMANFCDTTPTCQGVSDLLGTEVVGNTSNQGIAPQNVFEWFLNSSCTTSPQFWNGDECQLVADNFGPVDTTSNVAPSSGFLPNMPTWNGIGWWAAALCRQSNKAAPYHPRDHRMVHFGPG